MSAARTIPFGQTAVTKKNGTNGEHCVEGRRGDLRAKRNLRLARAVFDENNLFVDSERKKINIVSDV